MNKININGYPLDENQMAAATSKEKYSMIIAGAGSGKSTTMVGKIKYLYEQEGVNPNNILCISFTNDSCLSLKNSIVNNTNLNVDVLTFHKLALKILEDKNYDIVDENLLIYIIDELSYSNNANIQKFITHYLKNRFYTLTQNEFLKISNSRAFFNYKKDMLRFITLYRAKYETSNALQKWLKETISYKEKCFLTLALIIYKTYQKEKQSQNKIDFDDMIYLATDMIKSGTRSLPYKYIIIDEFQDTSHTRFNLVNAIINQNDANLTVVGDDFQSIYAFNGCTLTEFLNFQYNYNCELISINNVYRNSQELINIAGDFIMKNNKQIKKNLVSNKTINNPILLIEGYDLEELILTIYIDYGNDILVLGRNNKDIDLYLTNNMTYQNNNILIKNYPDLKCRFLTIHRSKGLEANNVIIINNNSGATGFPSEIEDNPILKRVKSPELYPFEEERRLFYVALTRSKNKVYLMYDKRCPSEFIKELKKNYLK